MRSGEERWCAKGFTGYNDLPVNQATVMAERLTITSRRLYQVS